MACTSAARRGRCTGAKVGYPGTRRRERLEAGFGRIRRDSGAAKWDSVGQSGMKWDKSGIRRGGQRPSPIAAARRSQTAGCHRAHGERSPILLLHLPRPAFSRSAWGDVGACTARCAPHHGPGRHPRLRSRRCMNKAASGAIRPRPRSPPPGRRPAVPGASHRPRRTRRGRRSPPPPRRRPRPWNGGDGGRRNRPA